MSQGQDDSDKVIRDIKNYQDGEVTSIEIKEVTVVGPMSASFMALANQEAVKIAPFVISS